MARELYFENILALLIAVEHEKSPEVAFKMMDHFMENGRLPKTCKSKITNDDIKDMHIYRQQGLNWYEIAKIFYKCPSYLSQKYKKFMCNK